VTVTTPVAFRRALVRWLQRRREPRLQRFRKADLQRNIETSDAATLLPRFVTWPPVRDDSERRALTDRVNWFLAPLGPQASAFAPVATAGAGAAAPAASLLTPSAVALLWKTRSWRLPQLLRSRDTLFFIVDPNLYASTEDSEWRSLYACFASPNVPAMLRARSTEAFDRLAADVGRDARINVCGNGPNLERILAHDSREDITIVCNGAARSPRLLQHVRPKIIAFINSPYFGPSDFAREHMATVQRCMDEYGSFLAIPEGYAHHLVLSHHPTMASRVIALQLGRTLQIPTREALVSMASANVLTSLMLPIAAALRPNLIRVWGCDGQATSRRGTWAYLPGAEPNIESVDSTHPAFVEGLRTDDDYLRRTYDAHGDHVERLLTHLEATGLRIVCASPSAIPALIRRTASSDSASTRH
jgi:hypothetical protein